MQTKRTDKEIDGMMDKIMSALEKTCRQNQEVVCPILAEIAQHGKQLMLVQQLHGICDIMRPSGNE